VFSESFLPAILMYDYDVHQCRRVGSATAGNQAATITTVTRSAVAAAAMAGSITASCARRAANGRAIPVMVQREMESWRAIHAPHAGRDGTHCSQFKFRVLRSELALMHSARQVFWDVPIVLDECPIDRQCTL
jgi:hypothetical protein